MSKQIGFMKLGEFIDAEIADLEQKVGTHKSAEEERKIEGLMLEAQMIGVLTSLWTNTISILNQ